MKRWQIERDARREAREHEIGDRKADGLDALASRLERVVEALKGSDLMERLDALEARVAALEGTRQPSG